MTSLEAPLGNSGIFDNIDSETQSRNIKMQCCLKSLVKGLTYLVQIADLVREAEKNDLAISLNQVWDKLTDGINLTTAGCHAINVQCCEQLKPKIQEKFGNLCTLKKPVPSKELFGEDLAKTVKDLDETNKVTQKIIIQEQNRIWSRQENCRQRWWFQQHVLQRQRFPR